jgi:hypothetical protein
MITSLLLLDNINITIFLFLYTHVAPRAGTIPKYLVNTTLLLRRGL